MLAQEELTRGVREAGKNGGARLVGIAPVERFVSAPEGHRPGDLLKDARSVISAACVMPWGTALTVPSISYMTYGFAFLDHKLHETAFSIAWFLEENGYISLPLAATGEISSVKIIEEGPEPEVIRMGLFSHRHAAVEAGLGEIGMNCALVTPQYGSRLRLVSVITTAQLIPDPKPTEKVCDARKCGFRCVNACPHKALPGDGTINQYRCLAGRLREAGEPDPLNKLKDYARAHPLLRHVRVPVSPPICARCIVCCPAGCL